MKKTTLTFLTALLLASALAGCSSSSSASEDLFRFKNSYIGDHNAVIGILRQLPGGGQMKQLALQTKTKPYGLTAQYKEDINNEKATSMRNAAYVFTLVQNAEKATFQFPNETFTYTRQQIEKQLGKDLKEIKKEEELKKILK